MKQKIIKSLTCVKSLGRVYTGGQACWLGGQIFSLVGGGRGVSFRDLLTLLVLVTRGTREEKFKCK